MAILLRRHKRRSDWRLTEKKEDPEFRGCGRMAIGEVNNAVYLLITRVNNAAVNNVAKDINACSKRCTRVR